MFFAALDLGSNTVSTLVRQAKSEGLVSVAKISECTRLGENLAATGNLQPAAMQRTIAAAARQLERIRCDFAPLRLTAVGTSAVRDAKNGADFLEQCRQELGLCDTPAVLSGQIEAELTFRGASDAFPATTPVINLDPGGASTEVALGFPGDLRIATSFTAGCVRWCDRFGLGDVFTEKEAKAATTATRELLSPQLEEFRNALAELTLRSSTAPILSVTGGTATSLAAVLLNRDEGARSLHGRSFTFATIAALQRRLARLPAEAREALPGLRPGRGSVLPAGLIILLTIMEALGLPEVMANTHGLRYGLTAALYAHDTRLPVCLAQP
ncbi:MAG: hypothetical protein GX937_02175 [Lentisphaerae bacterium]|jgi:exopolyphosphatase/guanosine-5'-triphosphate,3'-diphosphate pyrophosphatase|nr:hypothetical protein [Lentisphaerota bacterium]